MILFLLGSCLISPVMTFGSGKTAKEAQRDTMGDLMPPQLDVEGAWSGKVETVTIRVWADDTYRAQNVHWQRTFEEQLAYANAVLGPRFGLQLRADYHPWNRHPGAGRLEDDLRALATHDPGDRMFAVVGLTSALGLVSATFDELGMATIGGKHLVMRGYADLEERTAFDRAFPDLEKSERESVLVARRAHKLATVLLHELGHNLGCEHDPHRDTIMAQYYSHRTVKFTDDNRATILATIDQRLGRSAPDTSTEGTVATSSPATNRPLTIFVTDAGEWVVDGKYVDTHGLDNALADAATRDKGTELVIKRGKKAPADKLVDLLDRAKGVGLSNFTLGMN
ncbi:MAG: biopolymer transporter ExbD [Kofleriaceae bacterium]